MTIAEFPLNGRTNDAPVVRETLPLYWSIRREIWENRSITVAPLIVAGLVLFVLLTMTIGLPTRIRRMPTDPATRHARLVKPYAAAPAPIMFTTILVGFFYSLDALYGERRDRSILFWKSMPVSDRTSVLAKVCIPLVVLPAFALALSFLAQLAILLFSNSVLAINGISPGVVWRELSVELPVTMIYGLTAHMLWFAPIHGWFMLVSAWAKRMPLVWAALPAVVIGGVESGLFKTTYFGSFLRYRFLGAMSEAFAGLGMPKHDSPAIERLSQLSPLRFLTSPGLWLGLLFAALCFVAAAKLRRSREAL
jgi:ABC-2 type transport system permease protein